MQFQVPAHTALGVLNDARMILGTLESAVGAAAKTKVGRYFSESREGAVIKINPTFDVNTARTDIKNLKEDIVRIQDALFQFNAGHHLGPNPLTDPTISAALRRIEDESKQAGRNVGEITNSVIRLHLEGDDVVVVDVGELIKEYLNHVFYKRLLKYQIAEANNTNVTINVESPIMVGLLEGLVE
jgi:hypothetical protein